MKDFEDVIQYLKDKVERTNENNPKANTGAVILKEYNGDLKDIDIIVMLAVQTLQLLFIRHDSKSPAGTSKLTQASYSIGSKVSKWIDVEPTMV